MNDRFIGTTPEQERHRFDEAALLAYLSAHMPGFEGPLRVGQFGRAVEPHLSTEDPALPGFSSVAEAAWAGLVSWGFARVWRACPGRFGRCC